MGYQRDTLLHIYVDTREPKANYNFLAGAFPNHTFELRALPEGDYATEKVIVERKTVTDLYGSIVGTKNKPGRFVNQVSRLSTHNQIVVLLVIGNVASFIDDMKRLGIRADVNILYGAIASVSCRENIHLIWVENEWDGLITMVKFMQKVDEGEYKIPAKRDPEILLARYLKITHKQMIALRKKFETLEGIRTATDKDLMTVDGIGRAKAKTIRELLVTGW